MATFYVSEDFGDGKNLAGTDDSDADTIWDLQGNSRFGATIKAENISARIEMGMNESSVSSRRVYGEWDFGAGKMKVGKDYSPTSQFISGQVFDGDLGLLGVGTQYSGRHGQLAFSFGNFQIALIDSDTGLIKGMKSSTSSNRVTGVPGGPVFVSTTGGTNQFKGDVDDILPKLEVGWGMSFDSWNFNLMGGAQYFCIEDVTSFESPGTTDDVEVTSFVVGGDIGWNFGPGYVKGALSYGQNVGDAGWGLPGGVAGRDNTDSPNKIADAYQGGHAVWDGDDDTNDTYTAMGALVAGLKMSDMFSFEAGWGVRNDRTDEGPERDTTPWAAYLQSVIALAPGVYIIPEVGYFDFDDNTAGDDAGSAFYLGGKWQINF
jgi:hypothetical protein